MSLDFTDNTPIIILKKIVFHIFINLIIILLFIQCSPNSPIKQKITGAWVFTDLSGMYNEILISNNFFIVHNEVMGTTISEIIDLNDDFIITSSEGNDNIKYQILNSVPNHFVLFNKFNRMQLTAVDIHVDINLIGREDQVEISKYWKEFNKRKNSSKTTNIHL
jgi:hypothetical protein